MHLRLLSIIAALVFVAACETTPEDSAGSAGAGATSDDSGSSSSVSADDAGAAEMMEDEMDLGATQEGLDKAAGDRVFFGYDKYNINADGQRTLGLTAEWLAKYPNATLTIEGHCDERGTREYNLALGERRAQAVKSYLVALGVDDDRIATISYGKEKPAAVGSNEAAWSQNRRGVSIVN